MNEEQELRDRLESITAPASRIELSTLVRDGRRRTVRRRSMKAAGGAVMAVAVLVAVPAILTRTGTATPSAEPAGAGGAHASPITTAPSAACPITDLPVPAGMKNATAVAVDPTGKYVIGNSTVGQNFRSILWTDGRARALPLPGESVQATAVNASGVAVGLVLDGQQEYAFRYENGRLTKLRTTPGNWHLYPTPAINARGDIVINVEPRGNSGGEGGVVLLWKAGSTAAVELPIPAGAEAFDITDDGTIIGTMYEKGTATAGYAWDQKGNGRPLPVPAGQTGAAYAAQGDWATGGLWPSMSPALWNLRKGTVVNLVPQPATGSGTEGPGPGDTVNASGWVVANGSVFRAGDDPVELAAPSGQESRAAGVSDTGLVVGQAMTKGHDSQNLGPRTWRC